MMHCSWKKDAAFLSSNFNLVNQKYVYNNIGSIKNNKSICLCKHQLKNCHREVLGPFYPGQTVYLSIILNTASQRSASLETYEESELSCKTMTSLPTQINTQKCNNVTHYQSQK